MAECFLKMKDASSSPDVVQRERVPECVQAPLRRIESQTPAQFFDIAEHVSATEFRPVPGDEDQNFFRCDLLPAEEIAPEFERERDNPVFAALTVQGDEEVVEVDVAPLKAEDLVDSSTDVRQCHHESM